MKRIVTLFMVLALLLQCGCGALADAPVMAATPCGALTFDGQTMESVNAAVLAATGMPVDARAFASLDDAVQALKDKALFCVYTLAPVGQYVEARESALASSNVGWKMNAALLMRAGDSKWAEALNLALTDMREHGMIDALIEAYVAPVIAGASPEDLEPVDLYPEKEDSFDGMTTLTASRIVFAEDADTIRVAVTGALPPFDCAAADGTPCGLSVALLYGVSRMLGVNVELVPVAADARMSAVIDGTVDMALGTNLAGATFDALTDLTWSEPYYVADGAMLYYISKCGHLDYNRQTEEDVEAFTVAYSNMRMDAVFFDTLDDMLAALKAGEIDSASLLEPVGRYVQAHDPTLVCNGMDMIIKTALITRAEDTALLEKLNVALADMRDKGIFEELEKAYIEPVIAGADPEAMLPVDLFPENGDIFDAMTELAAHRIDFSEDADTIRVAVTGDLPPFDYVAADGTPCGFNVAMLFGLSRTMGVNIELIDVTAGTRDEALLDGTVDVTFWAVGGIAPDGTDDFPPDTAEGTAVTTPYFQMRYAGLFKVQ